MTCKALTTLSRLALIGCTALTLTSPAFGQNTCNPALDITITPPLTTFAVGQDVTINVLFGAGNIAGGSSVTISQMSVYLDCVGGVNVCGPAGCTNEGTYISYNGDSSIVHNLNCGGPHTVASNNPAGGAGTNEIIFTFTPALVIAPNTQCSLSMTVRVLGIGSDITPKTVTGRVSFPGLCDNQLDMFGCASYSYPIVNPQIQIVKDVDDDNICEGDEVNYDYAVTNIGNADLTNVIVVDDNGTPGTGDDFNPTFVPGSDVGNDGILSIGETWLYTHGPVALLVDTTNIATVTGDYVNAVGTVTVTHSDDADVIVNPPPSCSIEDTPGECEITLCVVTDACEPYTVTWSGPGGFSSTQECITLGAGHAAGDYCVRVIDCNGCESGGPGSDCCYTFVPPVAPSCTISVGDCPFPRTLTVNPTNCPGCTFQWGTADAGHTTCTPIGGETGNTLIVNAAGDYCVTVTADDGCSSTCYVNVPECEVGQFGCTPGYWKQCQHFSDWICSTVPVLDLCPVGPSNSCTDPLGCPTCAGATLWSDVFEDAFPKTCGGKSKTLLKVLSQAASDWPAGCGSNQLNSLGRHTVAALLNAAQFGAQYSPTYSTPQAVIDAFNAVYPGTNAEYNALKNIFVGLNEQGCPLNGQSDMNKDGLVNQEDLDILLSNWKGKGTGDLNGDGIVDGHDVMHLISWWGQ